MAKDIRRLVAITKEVIEEVFMINVNTDLSINEEDLEKEYTTHESLYRRNFFAFRSTHLERDKKYLTPRDIAPYNIDLFARPFKDTYHAPCQVYGVDAQ